MSTKPTKKQIFRQGGFAALLSTMFVMTVVLIIIAGLSLVTIIEQKISANTIHSAQAYYAAESGVEDSIYRLIKNKNYSTAYNFEVGSGSVAITISDADYEKNILAEGQKNNRFRKLQIKLNTGGQGASFYYGVQVGNGGLVMDNNSRVEGSVYSNGSIQGSQGATIAGDAWVANGSLSPDQQSVSNDSDFIFGQANPAIDAAQSFIPLSSGNLMKISLLLKKFGASTNKTVLILNDDNNQPSKNMVNSSAYGLLVADQISDSSYSWIDVALNAPIPLQSGAKYWILIDSSLNEANYLFWGKDAANGYAEGTGQYSSDWNASAPAWLDANGDLGFKAWFGQANNFLDQVAVGANAHANTISHSDVTGDAYFQTIHDTAVNGAQHPGSADPAPKDMPVSQSLIDALKAQAEAGGILTEDYIVDAEEMRALGPKKIVGNLVVSNGGDLTISGTIFVTGNITIFNNAKVRLGSNFGEYNGAAIANGLITIANGCIFYSNSESSYILLVSTKSGQAIDIANNSETALFSAPNGIIDVNNNTTLKELSAYQVHLNNGAQVIYESGLASILFSSGVSGSWEITSWGETP